MDDTEFILIVILCVVLPPLAVVLMYDISTEFWISLLLTLLFWVPGVIYALILAFDIY
ncbi:MAG: YqaE/Pmp3 family membrane protein [Flavobacteriales bacterium]|nr:YqaE/Pmp3 family membrane protein [Flavobacteriales bacterium]